MPLFQVENVEEVHWTFGVCSTDEETCLNERYDGTNITEITGIQLATLHPGSLDFALLESLTFPQVESMSCQELCDCLSCGDGHCSDKEDQDKCPGNTSGFICRCSSSPAFPTFQSILRDMMRTGMACRQCSNWWNQRDEKTNNFIQFWCVFKVHRNFIFDVDFDIKFQVVAF